MNPSVLTPKELRRYERHFMLPEFGTEGQNRLRNAGVLVVGAGGLGCPVLQYLAAAGIGRIGIADNDLVSEDNLQRQVLYGDRDLGKMKAIIARNRLQEHNPMVNYQVHNIYLEPKNVLKLIADYDVVVDATDNFPTRYMLNDACIHLDKPWVYGSIYKFEGQVSVFNFRGGPSLRCVFPEQPSAENAPMPSDTGMLGVIPGLTGMLMANEVIKIIALSGKVLSGELLLLNLLDYNFQLVKVEKNPAIIPISALKENYNSI